MTDREINLPPGWLQRDVDRAAERIEQWNKVAPMSEAELLAELDKIYHDLRFPRTKALALLRSEIAKHRREERGHGKMLARAVYAFLSDEIDGPALKEAFEQFRALPDLPTTEHGDG